MTRRWIAACRRLLPAVLLLALPAPAWVQDAAVPAAANPFAAFFGDWTLKDDRFQQVWDGRTVETLTLPNHLTHCAPLNTPASILCVIDAGDLKGHILWSYNGKTRTVHHLSHFGTERSGVGAGVLDARSNLNLRISFQDEPEGSYRQYRYEWVSADEYRMLSTQFDSQGKPTGNWYGGTFVRLSR